MSEDAEPGSAPLQVILERVDPSRNVATLFARNTLIRHWGQFGSAGRNRLQLFDDSAGADALETWLALTDAGGKEIDPVELHARERAFASRSHLVQRLGAVARVAEASRRHFAVDFVGTPTSGHSPFSRRLRPRRLVSAEGVRRRVHRLLEGDADLWAGHVVTRSIVAVILINLTAICLEFVPSLAEEWQGTFLAIEIASFAIFTVECGLRLWTAVYRAPYRKLGAGRASLQFALSPGGIIDLVAVLPFWLAYVLPTDFRVLLVLWMVRFLKLARYSPAISSLLEAGVERGKPCCRVLAQRRPDAAAGCRVSARRPRCCDYCVAKTSRPSPVPWV